MNHVKPPQGPAAGRKEGRQNQWSIFKYDFIPQE